MESKKRCRIPKTEVLERGTKQLELREAPPEPDAGKDTRGKKEEKEQYM